MNVDGSNQARFTDNQELGFTPPLSPDGTETTFYSTRDSNSEIYLNDTADSV